MTRQLLHPGALDEAFRSGLFLTGMRRTGKTTFLRNDLIPSLEKAGALVIYVDLWSDPQANPAKLVHAAVAATLKALESPASSLVQKLKGVRGADFGALGFKFGFKLDSVGNPDGPTLAQALMEVVEQARTDVVLIVDEVQHAMASEDGNNMLFALKAARDAINQRPKTPGYFLFIGTGSHRALVNEMTARRTQAFAGAVSAPYPVLGADYVEHLLKRLADEGVRGLPSLDVASDAFRVLGNRPEEFIRALKQLSISLPEGADADQFFPVIASTIRSMAAAVELNKVEEMGELAKAVFEKIASAEGDARGLFTVAAAREYSKMIGREVKVEEVQPVANQLLDANIIMRRGHGHYCVTDPFVREVWMERRLMAPGV